MLQRCIFSTGGFLFLASVFKDQGKKKTGVRSCLTLFSHKNKIEFTLLGNYENVIDKP